MAETMQNPTDSSSENVQADAPVVETETLLKTVLDEDRLAILGLTALRPYTARELAEALPGKRTPPTRHIKQLVEAGLLTEVGAESYALNVRQLQRWKRELFARITPVTLDEQILATVVRQGKIVQYPVLRSKRLVVLRWLATHFEIGRTYSEREVNEVLAGHSLDHATLRRYLVDEELLTRQSGIYQRTEK